MKKYFVSFLFLACLFLWIVPIAAVAQEPLEKEIDWINAIPGLTRAICNRDVNKMACTYNYTGNIESLYADVKATFVKNGWKIIDEDKSSIGAFHIHGVEARKEKLDLKLTFTSSASGPPTFLVAIENTGGEITQAHTNPTEEPMGGKYRVASGKISEALKGDFVVREGESLELTSTLEGTLLVRKNATALIGGTVTGDIVNYGVLTVRSTVTGKVINMGGTVDNQGTISGGITEK